MRRIRKYKTAAIMLCCASLAASPTWGQNATGIGRSVANKTSGRVADIALGANGTMHGRVINANGIGLTKVRVALVRNHRQVAVTETNKQGTFLFSDVRGGVYEVEALGNRATYRTWAHQTAPPAAKNAVQIQFLQQLTGGQGFGGGVLGSLGLPGAAVLGAVVATAVTIPVVVSSNKAPTS